MVFRVQLAGTTKNCNLPSDSSCAFNPGDATRYTSGTLIIVMTSASANPAKEKIRILHNVLTAFLAVAGFAIIAHYQFLLLRYYYWEDEGVNILVGRLIARGFRLYSDVFEQHGPLVFAPAALLELFGSFGIKTHRLPILGLQTLTAIALFFSPVFSHLRDRILFTLVSAGVATLFLPSVFGIGYNYQLIAGCLCSIILSQYALPAIIAPDRLTRFHIVIGSSLLGLLPFLAVSYWPATLLLFLSSITFRFWRLSLMSFLLAIAVGLAVTALYTSMIGYFAIHLYYNLTLFPKFQSGPVVFNDPTIYGAPADSSLMSILGVAVSRLIAIPHDAISFLLADAKGTYWATYGAAAFLILWLQDRSSIGMIRSILLALACLSFLVRGTFIHAVPFYCSCFTISIVFAQFGNVLARYVGFHSGVVYSALKHALLTAAAILLLLRLGWFYDITNPAYFRHEVPTTSRFAVLAQQLTNPSDRVIAYTFHPSDYLVADRLPASGNFYYLAHQEAYNRHPKFGIKFDTCADLRDQRPKLMIIDGWSFPGWPTWSQYAKCVDDFVATDYLRLRDVPVYIRKDLETQAKTLGIQLQQE